MIAAIAAIFWFVVMTGTLILFGAPTWGWLGFAFVYCYLVRNYA